MFFNKTSETEQISQITGYIGGSLVICLNIPLIIKTVKEKNGDSLSIPNLTLHILTSLVYITYGILIQQWPVIGCNIAYTIITCILIVLKINFSKKSRLKHQKDPTEEKL